MYFLKINNFSPKNNLKFFLSKLIVILDPDQNSMYLDTQHWLTIITTNYDCVSPSVAEDYMFTCTMYRAVVYTLKKVKFYLLCWVSQVQYLWSVPCVIFCHSSPFRAFDITISYSTCIVSPILTVHISQLLYLQYCTHMLAHLFTFFL